MMRLRLLPRIWEHLECPEVVPTWCSEGHIPRRLNAIMKTLRADTSLAASVRYFFAVSPPWGRADLGLIRVL